MKEKIVYEHSRIGACCVCGRSMGIGEHYYKIGRNISEYLSANRVRFRKRHDGFPAVKELKIYCSDCINSIFVDGDE
jgi:hypothetical protein